MSSRQDDRADRARMAFDAVINLSQDILEAHRLDGRGRAAEEAARIAVQRLPGVELVRVRWHGPQPGWPEPPLVMVLPVGSATPSAGAAWRAIEDVAASLVRQELDRLAAAG